MNPMLQNFFSVALPIMITFIAVIWLASHSQQVLLKDILTRLGAVEEKLGKVAERLTVLETRAGVIFHE